MVMRLGKEKGVKMLGKREKGIWCPVVVERASPVRMENHLPAGGGTGTPLQMCILNHLIRPSLTLISV